MRGQASGVRRFLLAVSLVLAVWSLPTSTDAAELSPPRDVQVMDTPSDEGGSVTVLWSAAEEEDPKILYQILLSDGRVSAPAEPGAAATMAKLVAEIPSNSHYVRDARWPWWNRPAAAGAHLYEIKSNKQFQLKDGTPYIVTVAAVRGSERMEAKGVEAVPRPNWVNWNQLNNLVLVILFGGAVLGSIQRARRREIFLRRIPGLDAVDEAIGRATELGKPILYLTGAGDMSEPSTLAAAVILGRVAKRVASYETDLLVPHRDPIVMAVCQEITKQSYLEANKPDAFKEDSNFFITTDQFSYTASVDGIMLRRKPAANFFMGSYFAESLLLTETGASTGAIQIAGTDSDHQLPFFVTTCDYTLIGEELYAASAYLSREPIQVGTLRGQDIGKAFILGVIAVGTFLATVGVVFQTEWPGIILDLFRDVK